MIRNLKLLSLTLFRYKSRKIPDIVNFLQFFEEIKNISYARKPTHHCDERKK